MGERGNLGLCSRYKGNSKNRKNKRNQFSRLVILFSILIALIFLVIAPTLYLKYSSNADAVFRDKTNATNLGVSLEYNMTNSAFRGYNYTRGNLTSLVFYNTTSTYWNLTFNIANSTGTGTNDWNYCNSNENCSAFYPLDNSISGNVFADVKSGKNGACKGTTLGCPDNRTGISSGGIYLRNDVVNITDYPVSPILQWGKGNFTISVWINPEVVSPGASGAVTIVSRISTVWEMLIYQGTLYGYVGSITVTGKPVPAKAWTHIVMMRNGTVVSLWQNGVFAGSIANTATSSGWHNVSIGNRPQSFNPAYAFNGTIDDLMFFNASLPTPEIKKLYKAGLSQHANTNITVQTRTAATYNISDPSLVAFWSFNNDNSSTAEDELGRNDGIRMGSIANANEGNGTVGKGQYFNWANSYINVTDNNKLDITGALTISAWVNSYTVAGTSAPVLGKVQYTDATHNSGYLLRKNTANWEFDIANNAWSYCSVASGVKQLKWQHIVGVYNLSTNTIYIDGVKQTCSQYAAPPSSIGTNTLPVGIGYVERGPDAQYFYGSIDEVRIYNRSLSAAEVKNLYNLGSYHIDDWGGWTNQQSVSDNKASSSLKPGKFMQFRAFLNSNSTKASPYLLNHSISVNKIGSDITKPRINFTSPTRGDNNFTNANSVYLNATSSDNNQEHSTFVDWNKTLAGWWRLEQGNGSMFRDNSTYGNNGTCSGTACPTYTLSGKYGGAYSFDGGDAVTIPDSSSLILPNDFTVNAWIKTSASFAIDTGIVVKHSGNPAPNYINYGVLISANNKARMYWQTNTPTYVYQESTNTINDGAWHLITIVRNTADSKGYLYIDGALDKSPDDPTVGDDISSGANNLLFGEYQYGFGSHTNFNGTIDDVQIWKRALSASEILALYNATANQYRNNFTSLSDANYTYRAYSQDLAGNVNKTSLMTIRVDTTGPSSTTSPANNTYLTNNILSATGGTITYHGAYTIHTFTTNETFNVTNGNGKVEVLVVAGGGGGGLDMGGGGGAGGLNYNSSYPVTSGTNYSVSVGTSGAGALAVWTYGGRGGNSTFGLITVAGGGGGGSDQLAGANGGSGGGGWGGGAVKAGGTGIVGQGNNGGSGSAGDGGGGGGAGGGGANGAGGAGGNGGLGLNYTINGSIVCYAGGGGGGEQAAGSGAGTATCGGGAGGWGVPVPGFNATNGLGGGGGGGGNGNGIGGSGGSGIVIVRYFANSANQNLTAAFTDNLIGVKNGTLWVYNSSGLYNSSSITGYTAGTLTGTMGIIVSFVDGVYTWFWQLFDFLGNQALSTNQTITIDTVNPRIAWGNNVQGNYVNKSQSFVYANISLTETNLNHTSFSIYNYTIPVENLVGYWNFDKNLTNSSGGEIAYDYSGRGNKGATRGGAAYTSLGNISGGYSFDGVNDYIYFKDSNSIRNLTGELSISLWMNNLNKSVATHWYAISAYRYMGSAVDSRGWYIGRNGQSGSNLQFRVHNSSTNALANNITFLDFYKGQWAHVVAVYKPLEYVRLYINGRLATEDTTDIPDLIEYTSTRNLTIGTGNILSTHGFNGSIDEVMIFNRSLTAGEVSALYNRTLVNRTAYYTETLSQNWTNLADGRYHYYADAKDNAGNYNSTQIRTITIDRTAPTAALSTPINNTYTATASQNLTAAFTDNLIGVKNGTLWIYNSSGLYNSSSITGYTAGTLTGTMGILITFVEGIYKWFWQLFDWTGNVVLSENRTLTVDTTYPNVSFKSPTPANGSSVPSIFAVNISIIETNFANLTWNFNGTKTWFNASNASLISTGTGTWLFNYTQAGLVTGQSYYFNVSVIDKAGLMNKTGARWIFTNRAPMFNAINNTPADNRSIDPGERITIRANISDVDYNLDAVILQWKNYTAPWANATNYTMNNLTRKSDSSHKLSTSTMYNSSFVLPSKSSIISYRIWANDTIGSSAYSNITNITSYWDCTWKFNSTDISSRTGWDSNKLIGNATINNTGDVNYATSNCSLDFRLTYDLAEGRIYFGASALKPSNTYTVAAGANRTVNVNATFGTERKQENFAVIANEVSGRTTLTYANVSGILVTSKAGPYLLQSISAYPTSSIYLTAGTFSLLGYVRNVMGATTPNATNTAYNVSFNWSLASGFTNSSGLLHHSYTNITDSQTDYHDVNLTFSDLASMTAGTKTFKLIVYGVNETGGDITDASGNILINNSVSITFLCYNTTDTVCVTSCGHDQDPDCAATTTTVTTTTTVGGGGGAGGGASTIKTDAQFELLIGERQSFTLPIANKYIGTRENIQITASGINSKYIDFYPKSIGRLGPGDSVDIEVIITAPAYFTKGKYMLDFDLSGVTISPEGQRSAYSERKKVSLYIVEVNREKADEMIANTKRFIEEMENAGLVVSGINSFYNLAQSSYDSVDFENVKSSYEVIEEIHASAFESKDLLEDLKAKLESAERNGINVVESKKLLYVAETAFNRGDYVISLERLKEAKLTYALEVKGEFNLFYSVKNNPLESLGILIIASTVGFASSLVIRLRLYKRKFKLLSEEEKLLLELMKVVQRECFENKHMSMEEYEEAMNQYENKLSETIEDKIRAETKIVNLMKLRGKKSALLEEKKRLIELIKELQNDYLNKGKIETRIYGNTMKSYSSRLADVEEQLTFVEAQKVLKEKNPLFRFFAFFKSRRKPEKKKKK